MNGTTKISGIQMFFLMVTFNVALPIMEIITPTVKQAKQDAWMAAAIGTFVSMLFTYIALHISQKYPEESFVGCLRLVFGKFFGSILAILYAVQWMVVAGFAARQTTDFLMPALQLYETPRGVVLMCIFLLVAYAAMLGGVESIARCSEFLGMLVIATIALVVFFTINVQHLDYLLPIIQPHLARNLAVGSIPSMSFLTSSAPAMVLYPHLSDKNSYRTAVWGVGASGTILVMCTVATVATFGANLPAKIWNPFFMLARYISIADFIQNIDAIVIVIWFLSAFIRVALYAWLAVETTSDFLGTDIKWTAAFVCAVGFVISVIPASIVQSTILYPGWIIRRIVLPVLLLGVPALGIIIAYLKKGRLPTQKKKGRARLASR